MASKLLHSEDRCIYLLVLCVFPQLARFSARLVPRGYLETGQPIITRTPHQACWAVAIVVQGVKLRPPGLAMERGGYGLSGHRAADPPGTAHPGPDNRMVL